MKHGKWMHINIYLRHCSVSSGWNLNINCIYYKGIQGSWWKIRDSRNVRYTSKQESLAVWKLKTCSQFWTLGFCGLPCKKAGCPTWDKAPTETQKRVRDRDVFQVTRASAASHSGQGLRSCEAVWAGDFAELMPNRTGTAGVVRSCLMAVYQRDLSEAMRFRRRPNYIHLAWTCQAGRGDQQERKEGWHSAALDQCQQIPNAAVAMTPAVCLHRVWPRRTQLSLWNLKPTETHQAPHLCQATPCSEGKACRYPRPLLPAP